MTTEMSRSAFGAVTGRFSIAQIWQMPEASTCGIPPVDTPSGVGGSVITPPVRGTAELQYLELAFPHSKSCNCTTGLRGPLTWGVP